MWWYRPVLWRVIRGTWPGRDLTRVYATSPQPRQAQIPIHLPGTQFPYLYEDGVELDHYL